MKAQRLTVPVCLGLTVAVTSCTTGTRAPQHYYVLDPAPSAASAAERIATQTRSPTLLVTPTLGAGFYDAQAIVYSSTVGTRAYYQLNSWTEPPSHRLAALLTERLRRSGAFASVTTVTGSARRALVLDTQLDEIYHDAVTRPGFARIALTATLSDQTRRFVTGQRHFTASAPAPTPDAAGAVQAFDVALGPLLDEVVLWVTQEAAESRLPP